MKTQRDEKRREKPVYCLIKGKFMLKNFRCEDISHVPRVLSSIFHGSLSETSRCTFHLHFFCFLQSVDGFSFELQLNTTDEWELSARFFPRSFVMCASKYLLVLDARFVCCLMPKLAKNNKHGRWIESEITRKNESASKKVKWKRLLNYKWKCLSVNHH